mmetsp:Transcript_15464/g.44788  ORF Transcript_15464/g.44788 Transcript_15464/m.44788 type:complete len:216 (-) Transcript_15464:104-751(-)
MEKRGLEQQWQMEKRGLEQQWQMEKRGLEKEVADLKCEIKKPQREIEEPQKRIFSSPSNFQPSQSTPGTSTDLVSAVAQDSLILDFQGPNSGVAANGAGMMAHLSHSLQSERDLRLKAEAIASTLGQRTKALKQRIAVLEAEKMAGRQMVYGANGDMNFTGGRSQQLNNAVEELERLRSIVGHLKSLYEMKETTLQQVETERDELRLEVMKYRGF